MLLPCDRRTFRRAGAAGLALATGTAGALALAVSADAATARTGHYVTRTLTQSAAAGLPVTAPLDNYRAVARARVVVPTSWRALPASAGQRRFLVTQDSHCHYRILISVTSDVIAPPDAVQRVTAELPAAGAPYVLSEGQRDGTAFRVVRRQGGLGGRVRLDARWTGILTRRDDIAPAGQEAWSDIRVAATSLAADECHAGTWRSALGPAIGDALAVARTTLAFKRAD
jgi:hypothetical protein